MFSNLFIFAAKSWKNHPQKLLIIGPNLLFHSRAQPKANSPKSIFHIIKMSHQPSVLLFVEKTWVFLVSLCLVYLFFHYFPVCNSGGSAAAGSVSSEVTLKFPLFSPLCLALLWLCLGSSVHQKVVFEELCGSARLRALLSVRAKRKWVAIEEMSRKSILHDIQIWLYTIKRASVDHVFKSSSSLSCELS